MDSAGEGLANYTHQLLVSVSKHLFVARHGILKYQEKPVDVHINNYANGKKEHLVYYVLRDRCSGNFIFDVATTVTQIPLLDFLHYAWKRDKEEDHFWGLPQSLSVPKRISSPELLEGLRMLGVETFHPSSGFASGIRILKDLEDSLCYYLFARSAIHSLDNVQMCKSRIYHYMLERNKEDNKVALWQDNLPAGHPQDVPDYDSFMRSFPVPAQAKKGLKLFRGVGVGAAGNGRQLDFLATPIDGKKYSAGKLFQAEEIVYEAWQVFDREKRLKLAYEALRMN
ncbi:MAG: hypothetical protein AB1796_08410 [Bacillota bacterium]